MSGASSAPENIVDGRIERSATTRRKILEATRQLLLETAAEQTARDIAARAGVTPRTLFRHFSDLESLHASLLRDAEERAAAVMNEPFGLDSTKEDWPALSAHLVERRSRVYESLLPLYVSSLWRPYQASQSKQDRARTLKRRRKRLLELLPQACLEDQTLFEAIDATLSIEYWASLRHDQGLSVEQATTVLRRALDVLTREQPCPRG